MPRGYLNGFRRKRLFVETSISVSHGRRAAIRTLLVVKVVQVTYSPGQYQHGPPSARLPEALHLRLHGLRVLGPEGPVLITII